MNRWILVTLFVGMSLLGGLLTLFSLADEAGWLAVSEAAPQPIETPKELAHDTDHPPQLVALETDYDFGVMDVGATGEHAFAVRNEGSGDLILELVGTSCKCTLADVPDGRIAPGQQCLIRMEWETQEKLSDFRHGAILRTNDPLRPELRLVITGRVRRHLVREPSELVIIGRALPTERASHGVWFYSQIHPALEVASVESTHPHLSWEVEPAREEDRKRWQATTAIKLKITLEPGQAEGRYGGQLKVQLRVPGLPEDQQPALEVVDVHTQVLSRVRFFGPQYEPGRILNLEQLVQGEGAISTVFLAIRGQTSALNVISQQVTPGFLDVRIEHDETLENGWTRYKIVVTVPADAPTANHLGANAGEVRLVTDHPDVPEIRFRVAVAIAPRPSSDLGGTP